MFNFLQSFSPQPIAFSLGPLAVHFYGLTMVAGMIAGLLVATKLAKRYGLKSDIMIDLAFWLILWGVVGGRLYDDLLNFNYYWAHPSDIFKVWQGGLAIHGGIIAGLLVIIIFARRHKLNFWLLTAIIAPALALGQAIGRWGNYFNQELFGLPTSLPWKIFISPEHRPLAFANFQFFHPTFLYESLGCFLIFLILLYLHHQQSTINNQHQISHYQKITFIYLTLYSLLRFSLEFIRLDPAPVVLGLRWPQWASLILIVLGLIGLFRHQRRAVKPSQS